MNAEYRNDESSLTLYLRDVDQNTRLLSTDEEYAVAVRAKNGDAEAKNQLIESNLRFVVKIAKQFQGRGLSLEDLIQEGAIGLCTAAEKFEPEKGYHFISYAVWWIRQSIQKAINEKSRMIRLPMNRTADLIQINNAKNKLNSNGEDSDIESIAAMCGLDSGIVSDLIKISSEVSSLDAPVGEDGKSKLGDCLESTEDRPEEAVEQTLMTEDVRRILDTLPEREKQILTMRYGLDGRKPLSLKEVGDRFSLTKERIRQIEKNTLTKLRNREDVKHLSSFVA